jgi:hypothetical protein
MQPMVSTMTDPEPTNAQWLQIPQIYLGRLNVVGDCYVFGVVIDRIAPSYKALPVLLSLAGPASSVEAAWAKLSLGKETSIVPDNAPAIYLEPTKAGLYYRYQKKIEGLGIDHLILVHENMAAPNYQPEQGETSTTYLLCTSEAQKLAKLGDHVRKTVKVAVFEAWLPYLYEDGLGRGLLQKCTGYGLTAYRVTLASARWTEVITNGLAKGMIHLP